MSQYLVLFRGGSKAYSQMTETDLENDRENWNTWMGNLAKTGKLVGGLPVMENALLVSSEGSTPSVFGDVSKDEVVNGYLLINADDIDEAEELLQNCPIFQVKGTAEIRELETM